MHISNIFSVRRTEGHSVADGPLLICPTEYFLVDAAAKWLLQALALELKRTIVPEKAEGLSGHLLCDSIAGVFWGEDHAPVNRDFELR